MLHIEKIGTDRCFTQWLVEGLSIDEMNTILNMETTNEEYDALVAIMGKHDNDSSYGKNIAEGWRNGYGIYGIRHFGGHLIVTVGSSCD